MRTVILFILLLPIQTYAQNKLPLEEQIKLYEKLVIISNQMDSTNKIIKAQQVFIIESYKKQLASRTAYIDSIFSWINHIYTIAERIKPTESAQSVVIMLHEAFRTMQKEWEKTKEIEKAASQ